MLYTALPSLLLYSAAISTYGRPKIPPFASGAPTQTHTCRAIDSSIETLLLALNGFVFSKILLNL